jgi:ADP-heptose:LPS heptosyltransferase
MKLAIYRRDGLGDLVVSLPLASAIRKYIPDARIVFFVSNYQAQLLIHHPDVDEIRDFDVKDRKPDLNQLSAIIREVRPDAIIDLLPEPRTAWLFFKHRIPIRIGTAFRWWSFLYNRRVKVRKHQSDRHEAEYNLRFLEPFGVKNAELIPPELFLSEEETRKGRSAVAGLSSPKVVIHPGSHGTSPNWPVENYAELTEKLLKAGLSVIVTGSRSEKSKFGASFVRFKHEPSFRDFMGKLNLRDLMAVLASVDVVVSCGTGVMHIAAALRTPTVSLFGSNPVTGPIRWGPLGNRSITLSPLENYTPGDVVEILRDFLSTA